MLFNSLNFLFFFPAVVFLYFLTHHKYRWVLLLVSSYFFYMSCNAEYVILLLASTLVSFFSALFIGYSRTIKRKRMFLGICLLANLGLLFTFKYFNFTFGSLADFLRLFGIQFSFPMLKLLLPLGISFFTFQSIGYVVDVYRGKVQPEKHFGIFALYLSFFPRLVAGPIERAGNLIPQFFEKHDFNYERVTNGLKLMAWGFLKKLVIADGLAFFVDRVYNNLPSYSGPALVIATFFYAVQIFCDFSGYTDIAIGSAQVLGYRLMDNFLAPYSAKSIAEFWRRWHISLSSWFQDYVFNPLYFFISKLKIVSNSSTKIRHWLSFVVAMLLGESLLGLWHGANWTFVFFGLYHWVAIICYYLIRKWWDKLPAFLAISLTFLITTGGWVFFRANSLSDVWYVFSHLFIASQYGYWHDVCGIFLHYEYEFAIVVPSLVIVILAHWLEKRREGVIEFINNRRLLTHWVIYYVLVMTILLFGSFGSKQFIYFNF